MFHFGHFSLQNFYELALIGLMIITASRLHSAFRGHGSAVAAASMPLAQEFRRMIAAVAFCEICLIGDLFLVLTLGVRESNIVVLLMALSNLPVNKAENALYRLTHSNPNPQSAADAYAAAERKRFATMCTRLLAASEHQQGQLTKDGLSIKRFVRREE